MKQKPTKKIDNENAEVPPDNVFSKTDKLTMKFRISVNRIYDLINEFDHVMEERITHAYHVGIARGLAKSEKRKAK